MEEWVVQRLLKAFPDCPGEIFQGTKGAQGRWFSKFKRR
jgi:hypothetical protein